MYSRNHLSFQETKDEMAAKLFALDQKCRKGIITIADVGDYFPVGLLINSQKGENLYMNKSSERTLGYSAEETRKMGNEYSKAIQYNERETLQIIEEIDYFYNRQDNGEILAQFQRVKPKNKNDYEWVYIASKLLFDKPKEPAYKRLLIATPVKLMGHVNQKIHRVLEENLYMKKNFNRFATLTKREKEILSLVASGKETKCIADELYISHYTVEQHRKNITKKVEHKNFTELIKFAMAFDLV